MKDALLALHLLGLMMGAGGGFGSMIAMNIALKRPPEQAGPIRSLGPSLARFSLAGLALLWVTGLVMVFTAYGGFGALPRLFWWKFLFVLTLTVSALLVEITYRRVKAGDAKAAALLPRLGPISGVSSLLAMALAVFAFH